MNPITYFQDTWTELKKVTWPTRQETIKLTLIVIVISILVGVYIGSLDYTFTNLLKLVIK